MTGGDAATDRTPDRAPDDEGTDPPRAAQTAGAPVLTVDGFEGPLDWLLDLVRADKIDLARLPILALIECFCGAFDRVLAAAASASALARCGDWLVMAATLTHLRSRLVVPDTGAAAPGAADQAEDLRARLLRRAHMAEIVDWLDRQPQRGRDFFGRGAPESEPGATRSADITDLLRACLVIITVPVDQVTRYQPARAPLWRVADASARMVALLGQRPEGGSLGAFLPEIDARGPDYARRCRAALASTLVAGLELARTGMVGLTQAEPWQSIGVTRRESVPVSE